MVFVLLEAHHKDSAGIDPQENEEKRVNKDVDEKERFHQVSEFIRTNILETKPGVAMLRLVWSEVFSHILFFIAVSFKDSGMHQWIRLHM